MRFRHTLLLLMIVCCVMAVVLPMTIWVFPFRSRIWLLESLLGLTSIVGALGLATYVCVLARSRGMWPRLMVIGMVGAIVAAILFTAGVAYDGYEVVATRRSYGVIDQIMDHYLRPSGFTMLLAAVVAGQWAVLSLLRLDRPEHRQYRSIVRYAAVLYACIMAFIAWGGEVDLLIVIPLAAVLLHASLLWAYIRLRRRGSHARHAVNSMLMAYAAILVVLFAWGGWIDPIVEWSYNRSTFGPSIDAEVTRCATIVIIAATAIVPLLAMLEALSRTSRSGELVRTERFDGTCIHCGQRQAMRVGRNRCAGCGVIIDIQIEEPRCECGYLLYQLKRETCPECGRKISELPSMATRIDPRR